MSKIKFLAAIKTIELAALAGTHPTSPAGKEVRDSIQIIRDIKFNLMVQTLEEIVIELKDLVKDEKCDHSVGICWCEQKRLIENAEELTKAWKE